MATSSPVHWLWHKAHRVVRKVTRSRRRAEFPPDFEPHEIEDIRAVKPFTATSRERIVSLVRAVDYLAANHVAGDIVECGVYKGGSIMAAARALLRARDIGRQLWLYDTFEGMTEPQAVDVSVFNQPAHAQWERDRKWCFAGLEEVRRAVLSTGYPERLIHFVQGRVEETIPARAPEQIALLRLDTDWYESTMHELVHLYPRLVRGGIIIIDDYGHWQGARKATDEYLASRRIPLFLGRIDYTARIGVKP